METTDSAGKKQTGEKVANVLYWAAWCFLGVNVLAIVLGFFRWDWPEKFSHLEIVYYSLRQNAAYAYYMFVLFGISALLKVGGVITIELKKLNSDSKRKD